MPVSDQQNDMEQSKIKPRIAILGAGLMGRMLAVSLKNDYAVELFDQDKGQGQQSAAYLAAAMLAPLAESADATQAVMQLGELALKRWPAFLQTLSTPVFFQQTGSLIVAFEQDLGDLKQFKSRLKGKDFEEVADARVRELEPDLNERLKQGLYLPNEGQLDNRELLNALGQELLNSDVIWHYDAFITPSEKGFLHNGQAMDEFDTVFDCRGFGAKVDQANGQANLSSSRPPLRGVRGEVVRIKAPDVKLNRPVRLMHPRYPIYISPKENGVFVVGATQLESEDIREPTVRSALELLSACFSVSSGFAEAEILGIYSGIRPAYLDNEPKITLQGNVITVNGLFRHGFMLAPVMLEQCLNVLNGTHKTSEITQIMPDLVQELEL